MKIKFPDRVMSAVTKIKDFYFPKRVYIEQYYANDNAEKALRRLDKVKDVFEPYAKAHGVSLQIDKGITIFKEDQAVNPALKAKLENSIVMKVINNFNFKERNMLIDVTTDSFKHTDSKKVVAGAGGAVVKNMIATTDVEDNFIRHSFRVFERLTSLVKK